MTREIQELTNIARSSVFEDYEENITIIRYLDLKEEDFCCKEIYQQLLGEDDGRCELAFGYEPSLRHYYIRVLPEYGGSLVSIKHCPWCGKKFPKDLGKDFKKILNKEYNLDIGIFDPSEDSRVPEEFLSDQWWKNRNL